MYDCVECYCVSYCSIQHKDQNKLHHQTMCRPLRLAMLADTYEVYVVISNIGSEAQNVTLKYCLPHKGRTEMIF